ncbi:MAG: heavy metal-binding domain-containing protein, partial [Methanosarcina thermophila]
MTNDIIIVSTPYLPGYKITKTIGFTWGLIVRSRGLGRNITAGLRSIIGGEIHEYTELLNQSREQALDRLKEHAKALGANAVINVQFDSSEMGQAMTELLAYIHQPAICSGNPYVENTNGNVTHCCASIFVCY